MFFYKAMRFDLFGKRKRKNMPRLKTVEMKFFRREKG